MEGTVGVSTERNPRGIPKALFIENVETFMKDQLSADDTLKKMQDNYSKYKYMEQQLSKSRVTLKSKIPDLRANLQVIEQLKRKKEAGEALQTHFELADQVYANATVKPTTVSLWLGANVMVEYSFDEAHELLSNNLSAAERNLGTLEEDIAFLKDQITTTEVNIARVFNYDVKQRRSKKSTA